MCIRDSGILFLVFGAVKLAGFFSKDPYQLVFESDLVFGILYLALGLLLLLRPAHTMAFLGICLLYTSRCV